VTCCYLEMSTSISGEGMVINARKQLTFLAALLLVATSGFAGGAAVAQTKNGFSLNDLPLAKLGAGAERRREFVAAERHYPIVPRSIAGRARRRLSSTRCEKPRANMRKTIAMGRFFTATLAM